MRCKIEQEKDFLVTRRLLLSSVAKIAIGFSTLFSKSLWAESIPAQRLPVTNIPPNFDPLDFLSENQERLTQCQGKAAIVDLRYRALDCNPVVVKNYKEEISVDHSQQSIYWSKRITDDFDKDKTCAINGWLYSETEIELLELFCQGGGRFVRD